MPFTLPDPLPTRDDLSLTPVRTKINATKQIKPTSIKKTKLSNSILKSVKLANNKVTVDTNAPGLITNADGSYSGNVKLEYNRTNVYENAEVDTIVDGIIPPSLVSSIFNNDIIDPYGHATSVYNDPNKTFVTSVYDSTLGKNVLSFNSTNNTAGYYNIRLPELDNGDFSVELKVYNKTLTHSDWQSIIGNGNYNTSGGFNIYFDPSNKIHLAVNVNTGVSYGSVIPINTWVTIKVTYVGTTLSIFVNGVSIYSATNALTRGNGNYFRIGETSSGTFNALISDVKFYDKNGTMVATILPMSSSVISSGTSNPISFKITDKYEFDNIPITVSNGSITRDVVNKLIYWTIDVSFKDTTQTLTIDGNPFTFSVV